MKENETNVMSRGELARRYFLLVVSLKATALSLGSWLILWNFLLIAGQILLLRRRFSPVQLLQVPLSFLFCWFTDLGVWLAGFLPVSAYPVRLGLVVLGTLVLAVALVAAIASVALLFITADLFEGGAGWGTLPMILVLSMAVIIGASECFFWRIIHRHIVR